MALPHKIINQRDGGEAVLAPGERFELGITQEKVAEVLAALKQAPDPIFTTEKSPRLAFLRDFYIDVHPVTNRQYALFMQATRYASPLLWNDRRYNQPNQPVTGVCFRDAIAYANWAGKRLPTEEEWERAARGDDSRAWPWGDEFDRDRCNSHERLIGHPTEVGSFPSGASPVGACEMAGNVWELTTGEWEGFGKAIRGGSYKNPAAFCRTTCRWGIDPNIIGSAWLGFRCVMDVTKARIVARVAPA